MEHTFDLLHSDDKTLIRFGGELTVRNARKIAAQLTSITTHNVTIELNNPLSADLSFVQILAAYTHLLSQKGLRVEVKASLSDADVKLFVNSGFADLLQFSTTPLTDK